MDKFANDINTKTQQTQVMHAITLGLVFLLVLKYIKLHSRNVYRALFLLKVNFFRYSSFICVFLFFNFFIGASNYWRQLITVKDSPEQPSSWEEVGGFLRLVKLLTGGFVFEILTYKQDET